MFFIADEQPFPCHLCCKSFKHSWLKDKHVKLKHSVMYGPLQIPNGDVPGNSKGGSIHLCKICHKAFPYWNTYLHHVKAHKGIL